MTSTLRMRAQILRAFGGPENFELAEIPKPEVQAGMVLVRLVATSVNAIDIKIRTGLPIGPDLPAILGADVAGIVEEVGAGVLNFRPGDEVYGCDGGVKGQGGTLAEYILVDARLIRSKPRTLSMHEAAALPLVSITTWDAIGGAGRRCGRSSIHSSGSSTGSQRKMSYSRPPRKSRIFQHALYGDCLLNSVCHDSRIQVFPLQPTVRASLQRSTVEPSTKSLSPRR